MDIEIPLRYGALQFAGDDRNPLDDLPTIKFRNDASSTAPAWGILRITGFITDPEESYLTVDQPNAFGCQDLVAVNTGLDVQSGSNKYGYCFVGGLMPALYDSGDGTPQIGEFWGPRSGSWKLRKNTGGFRVRGIANSTLKTAAVLSFPMTSVRGKFATDLAPDTSDDMTVWVGDYGSEAEQTGQTVSVRNASSCTITGGELARATWNWDNAKWQIEGGKTA